MGRTIHLIFLALVLPVGLARGGDRGQITLVESGKPAATIVLGQSASQQAREAARTLQTYLERISGAKLDIRSEKEVPKGTRILVGRSQAVKELGIAVPSGLTNQMNDEGFVIHAAGSTLVLAGNEDWQYHGTTYAVSEFLEDLGCRWFFPGPYGEVVPSLKTISVAPVQRTERPDFRFRNIWYSGWFPTPPGDNEMFTAWTEHNKVNSLAGLSLPGDGSITRLAPPEKYFKTHPEIYAVNQKGERVGDMLCLTEPEAVRIAVQTITETFRKDPSAMTFGFAPPDGHPMCYCERCRARNSGFEGKGYGDPSLSDAWFEFANQIAVEVRKEFPDRWLLTNGYANRVRVPETTGKLSPNLGIQSAMIASCTLHRIGDPKCWQRQLYQQVFDRWTDQLPSVFVYDYDPGKGLEGLPFPALHCIEHDMRYYKDRRIWGFWTEGQNCWMITHLNYYVRAKLMWNVQRDVHELVRDYCQKFYGRAAEPIEAYVWALEDAVERATVHVNWGRLTPWRVILTPDTLATLDARMSEAEKLASKADELEHVRVLSKVHEHMKAFVHMEQSVAEGKFQEGVADIDHMLAIRDELGKVQSGLLPHTPEYFRKEKSTPEWYRYIDQKLADRAGGKLGELVVLLPQHWQFRLDREDMGVFYQWYLPGKGDDWHVIDTTNYWESQGYQDRRGWGSAGPAWYRTSVEVPASVQGKPLRMTVGGVYSTKLWIWINGVLVDHRARQNPREPFDVDVTGRIKPGQTNQVALLVQSESPGRDPRSGLHRRVFLWTPK